MMVFTIIGLFLGRIVLFNIFLSGLILTIYGIYQLKRSNKKKYGTCAYV